MGTQLQAIQGNPIDKAVDKQFGQQSLFDVSWVQTQSEKWIEGSAPPNNGAAGAGVLEYWGCGCAYQYVIIFVATHSLPFVPFPHSPILSIYPLENPLLFWAELLNPRQTPHVPENLPQRGTLAANS